MAFIVWESKYDVGVSLIDKQHRRIVDYINQLHDAIESQDKASVVDVLDQLKDYTVAHFGFEETMQEQGEYPHLDAHRKSHEAFARKIERYQERYDSGENISGELLSELHSWLHTHIRQEDGDLAPYLKNNVGRNGVSAVLAKIFG